MADIKITNLPLGTDIADDDELLYIDVSDQTAGPDGTDKRVLVGSLRNIAERNATTEDLIASDLSSLPVGKVITTVGFYESGDGGGAQWVKTAETGTPSSGMIDNVDTVICSADGSKWELTSLNYRQTTTLQSVRGLMLKGDTVSISVIGDSITWGSDGNDTGTQVAEPYPNLLQGNLRSWYSNDNITVVNNGYSGRDSSQIIGDFLEGIIGQDNDLYLIGVGVNDARTDRGITPEQYKRQLRVMALSLIGKPIAFVSLTEVVSLGTPNGAGVDHYRQAAREVADEVGALWIDAWSLVSEQLLNLNEVRGKVNRDRLHWSQEGYKLIADAVFTKGFAEVDLITNAGQFIDASFHNFKGGDLGLVINNSQYTVSQKLFENETAKLFIYVKDDGFCDLVSHVTINLVEDSTPTRGFSVENLSNDIGAEFYNLTILNTTSTTTTNGYPINCCKLIKGLNIIEFKTTSSVICDFQGFSVVKSSKSSYLLPDDNLLASDKLVNDFNDSGIDIGTKGFTTIAKGVSCEAGSSGFASVAMLNPRVGESRYRIRGYFNSLTNISLGSSVLTSTGGDNWVSDYTKTFTINFRSLQTVIVQNNIKGNTTTLASLSTAGSGDYIVDIQTNSSYTKIFIDGVLLYEIPVKLCIGQVSAYTDGSTGPLILNGVYVIGSEVVEGALIPGEEYTKYEGGVSKCVVGVDAIEYSTTLT